MAYIPPHKRQSKDGDNNTPLPTPSLLVPHQFHKRSNLGSSSTHPKPKIIYAEHSISKWFVEGRCHCSTVVKSLGDDTSDLSSKLVSTKFFTDPKIGSTSDGDDLPAASVRMEPFRGSKSLEPWKRLSEPFALACESHSCTAFPPPQQSTPWVSIAENIRSELHDSFGNVREEIMGSAEVGAELKPSFVVRIGKILFHGEDFSGGVTTRADAESCFGRVRRSFCTNLSESYMEAILATDVPKIGVDISYQAKEYYHVKVHDECNPGLLVSIKCRVVSGKLQPHKIELNQKRCLVVDVSCLDKELDLRLMLSTKRGLTASEKDDAEKLASLGQLVECAILDPNAKGGVRWAMGKNLSSDGRYTVIGVWHTNVQSVENLQLKLRLRNADRYDFWASDGEVSNEVTLELKGINNSLITGMVELEPTIAILQETLKLVWDHFLS